MRSGAFFLTLAIALGAAAQQQQQAPTCTAADTPVSCWNKFVPTVAPSDTPATTQDQVQDDVTTANTGVTNLVSPSGSALKDFLSVFSASLESSTVTNNGNTVTLDTNLPAPINGDRHKIKLQVVITTAELDSQIVSALGSNSTQITALEDELSSTDDVTASLSYNPSATFVGRSIVPHGDFFDALVAAAFPTQATLDQARRTAIRKANITTETVGQPFSSIADPDVRAETIQAFQASASAIGNALKSTDTMRDAFALLLSNQPQAFLSGLYHYRSELVGPDEYSVKATYEMSSRNLRSFYRLYKNCTPGAFRNDIAAADRTATAADCLTKMQQYAAPLANMESGTRLAVSLDYDKSQARTYTLPENLGTVTNAESHSTKATLTLGFVPMGRASGSTGRLDFSASYEDVSGDPLKDDRFVASATYTQKINDTLSIPISLVYANHDQYLSNVNEKLNAHFGLIYKLPTN
jgi:hypothetical protein